MLTVSKTQTADAGAYVPQRSPQSIIARVAAGDQVALGELYDRFAGCVHAIALRILHVPADAEDVVQLVFVQIWREAYRYDSGRGTPEAWIGTMTRTRALDRLRQRVARKEASSEAAPGTTATPAAVECLAVRKALQTLSEVQRTALELAYYEGLTQKEISERLRTPLGTIKTHMRCAMMQLRGTLAPLAPEGKRSVRPRYAS